MTGDRRRPRTAPLARFLVAMALLAASGASADRPPDPAPRVPWGFRVDRIVPGPFEGYPVGFAFLPDGRALLIERTTGNIRVVPVGSGDSRIVYTVPDLEGQSGERGLLGIAVDPAWPARPFVYLLYIHESLTGRIAMVRGEGDLEDPTSEDLGFGEPYPLLTGLPLERPFHHGGTVRMSPDGLLYASLGDNLSPCDPQSPRIHRGKILRLDVSRMPGPGAGPPDPGDLVPVDNPFRGPDRAARLVWAMGLRNPFRFTIDAPTGDLWIGDVGEAQWEEVNHLPRDSGGGQNFGWPRREGLQPHDWADTCGAGAVFTDPVYTVPHDPQLASAIIGGPLYRAVPGAPLGLPTDYEGSYFFADHNRGVLVRLVQGAETGPGVTPDEWIPAPPEPGQPERGHWGTGFRWVTDLQEGPDGCLWLIKWEGTVGLYRIARDIPGVTDAAGPDVPGPLAPRLVAEPNPVPPGGSTRLRWTGAGGGGPWVLRIVDVAGRTVRILEDGTGGTTLGSRRFRVWDGTTSGSRPASAGTYFARLEGSEGRIATARLTLLR